MNESLDVLVVGAGPAGIAAAVRAAESGLRVGLVDDNPAAGGQIWRAGVHLPPSARSWFARLDRSSVTRLQGWRIFDRPDPGVLLAERSSGDFLPATQLPGVAELRYRKLILATGARERFLPFPGWTLPNVMGAGGLDAMVRGGLPIAGKRVVVAGTGPLLLAVAAHLAESGAQILVICEQAPLRRLLSFSAQLLRQPAKLGQGTGLLLAARRARLYTSCWPVSARGSGKLESVTLRRGEKSWDIACDYLACGFHLVPNLELPLLLGCRTENGFVTVDSSQQTSVAGVYCAGEPTGIGGVERALIEGQIAGLAVAGKSDQAASLTSRRRSSGPFVRSLITAFALDPRLRTLPADQTLVCRCEDVAFGALRQRRSWRDAKLHTRCGMGPCQGRICGAATEFLFGWPADSVRPPILPALISSLAASGTPPVAEMAAAIPFHSHRKDNL